MMCDRVLSCRAGLGRTISGKASRPRDGMGEDEVGGVLGQRRIPTCTAIAGGEVKFLSAFRSLPAKAGSHHSSQPLICPGEAIDEHTLINRRHHVDLSLQTFGRLAQHFHNRLHHSLSPSTIIQSTTAASVPACLTYLYPQYIHVVLAVVHDTCQYNTLLHITTTPSRLCIIIIITIITTPYHQFQHLSSQPAHAPIPRRASARPQRLFQISRLRPLNLGSLAHHHSPPPPAPGHSSRLVFAAAHHYLRLPNLARPPLSRHSQQLPSSPPVTPIAERERPTPSLQVC